MPETKKEQFIFTLMMAFTMVSFMASYNVILRMGISYQAFLVILQKGIKEYICAVPIAFLFSSIASLALAKNYCPQKQMKFFPVYISFFTVMLMVPIMTTIVALLDGFYSLSLIDLLGRMKNNFIFALPIQIFVAGPLVKFLFSKISKINTSNLELANQQEVL